MLARMSQTLAAHIEAAQECERRQAWDDALRAYEAALAEAPLLAEAHFNRANLLRRQGRSAEALAGYGRTLAIHPRWAAAHLNRGALLAEQGRTVDAIAAFRLATRFEPRHDRAWGNLGNALSRLGRHQDAVAALQTAVRLAPQSAIAQFNLGNALTEAGRPADAAQAFLAAIGLDPAMAEAAVNLSARLRQLGAPEAALNAAQLAVHATPTLPQAQLALGNALYDLGQFGEAEACLRRAVSLRPGWALALANLGLVLSAQGGLDRALQAYDAAIASEPGHAQALFGRATCLLAMGDFGRGWPAFAARFLMPGVPRRGFRQPVWRGEPAEGRILLVHAEQGFGDTLQFVRFAPLVAAASGARVILEVQPELVRLLTCLPGVERVVPRGAKLPRFDLHCPMLDLPGIFAPALESEAPYIAADPDLVAAHRLPDAGAVLRVGMVWAGQSRSDMPHAFAMDRRRSLSLQDLEPLAALSRGRDVRLVSLQFGPPAGQLKNPPDGLVIVDGLAGVKDFADTAAIVSQLDLVIAVDTSTAHLAGAMGKPVWLLSRFDACWRWMLGRSDSPWYPTMTLFRQSSPNAWGEVIAEVARRLRERKGPLL
jgi:tetratricopeptide (TPR) repeat protein